MVEFLHVTERACGYACMFVCVLSSDSTIVRFLNTGRVRNVDLMETLVKLNSCKRIMPFGINMCLARPHIEYRYAYILGTS